MTNDIRADLFAHLQNLPPSFHKEAKLSDLVALFSSDMGNIEEAVGKELLCGALKCLMLFSFGLMMSINWQLALLSLLPLIGMAPLMLSAAGHFAHTS